MIKWNGGRSGNDVLHVDGAGHYGCKMGSESVKHLVPVIFVIWDCVEEWTDKEFFVVELLWSEIMTDSFGQRWIHDYSLQREVWRMKSWCCQYTSRFLFLVKNGDEILRFKIPCDYFHHFWRIKLEIGSWELNIDDVCLAVELKDIIWIARNNNLVRKTVGRNSEKKRDGGDREMQRKNAKKINGGFT